MSRIKEAAFYPRRFFIDYVILRVYRDLALFGLVLTRW
jgi:hypothetical protein